jgi:hypothetical protein
VVATFKTGHVYFFGPPPLCPPVSQLHFYSSEMANQEDLVRESSAGLKRMSFPWYSQHVPELLGACDGSCFHLFGKAWLPSRAMAAGLPTIATEVDGEAGDGSRETGA